MNELIKDMINFFISTGMEPAEAVALVVGPERCAEVTELIIQLQRESQEN
jgi:hypothetical protein